MTAFSRLQLAAALLEYDNDPDDPNPPRLAENSAIFSHIRTRNAPRARTMTGFEHLRETPNHLGVELPVSETASARGSLGGTRISRTSIDLLRNPFGGDDIPESEKGADEEEYKEEELEVDLEAWGMTDFLGNKEKHNSKNRRSGHRDRQISKAHSEAILNANAPSPNEFGQLETRNHRPNGRRSQSMGGLEAGNELLNVARGAHIASEADFRRRSVVGPLSQNGRKTPEFDRPLSASGIPLANRSALRNSIASTGPQAIPFPSSGPETGPYEDDRNTFDLPLTSPTSRFDPKVTAAAHMRTLSNGSFGSHPMVGGLRPTSHEIPDQEDNPFAIPPPAIRTSRFDPKAVPDVRPSSRASIGGTMGTQGLLDPDNPFTLPPPSPTRTSRFDPKMAAHARTLSNASLGSRLPLDTDHMSIASGQLLDQDRHSRRYSRMDLMRPKVLIMPSPLQGSEMPAPEPQLPPGFQASTVGPPLPPGAKSAGRPVSHLLPSTAAVLPLTASSTLTPNPRLSLSLSQLTFRNSLMIGGQRDVAYEDIERGLRRAGEDGEQIYQEEDIEEEIAEEQKQAQGKAPGKLYGRSLMDELEARKEKMRSKQRVFTGDQRPVMMSRGQIRRSSTLIDPATLNMSERPPANPSNGRPALTRRGSSSSKPLLNFSDEGLGSPGAEIHGKVTNSKSVFGVDQLWERELSRLQEMEAAEKAAEEERQRREEEKAAKKVKDKGKGKNLVPTSLSASSSEVIPQRSKLPDLPPTLPTIPKATARRAPLPAESDSDTDSEASANEAKANAARRASDVGGWGSSDEEDQQRQLRRKPESDSEDDVPLSQALRLPSLRPPSPDSEDEKPLAQVLERKSMLPDFNFDSTVGNSGPLGAHGRATEDEDDMPLAVRHPRASAFIARSTVDEDDDETPLALKQVQQQQQQAQYNMMAQQQMMVQAQFNNSMVFGAPSMMSGFSPFMMPPPVSPFGMAAGPPVADAAKYQSVDRWRHDVAAD